MQKTITLFILLVSMFAYSQVTTLSKLSSGKFIDNDIIYDEKGDVFGYFLLYQNDRLSREIFDYEYVILDKNLNKISSKTFRHATYKTALTIIQTNVKFVNKVGNNIFVSFVDNSLDANSNTTAFNERYRKIDLTTFDLSDEIVIQNFKPITKKYQSEDVVHLEDFIDNQNLLKTNGNYFVSFATPEINPKITLGYMTENKRMSIKSLAVLDGALNIVWKKEINKVDKFLYRYINSDKSVFLMGKKNPKQKEIDHIELYDFEKGYISGFDLKDSKYNLVLDETRFVNNKIILYTLLHTKDKKIVNDAILGYAKIEVDKKTGKELNRSYMVWDDLKPNLEFKDEFGTIEKYGNLYHQDFIKLENGNSILILEGYKKASTSELLDLFIIELDVNFKVKYFKKIEKTKTVWKKFKAHPEYLKFNNLYDYLYHQKLDNDGNLVFFYVNKEKQNSETTKKKKSEWVLGIITYVDGTFNFDKLQLTSEDSKIIPGKAKNGYIQLIEVKDDNIDVRLERINY